MCLGQLAIQVAIVFAKVARTDYPKEWPSLFDELTSRLQANSVLTTRRVYLALHHIIKELSSKRLAADQRNFAEVPPFNKYTWCGQQTLVALLAGWQDGQPQWLSLQLLIQCWGAE